MVTEGARWRGDASKEPSLQWLTKESPGLLQRIFPDVQLARPPSFPPFSARVRILRLSRLTMNSQSRVFSPIPAKGVREKIYIYKRGTETVGAKRIWKRSWRPESWFNPEASLKRAGLWFYFAEATFGSGVRSQRPCPDFSPSKLLQGSL